MGECSSVPLCCMTPGETIHITVHVNRAPWNWAVHNLCKHLWRLRLGWGREAILALVSYGSLERVIPTAPLSYDANRIERPTGEMPKKNSKVSVLLEEPQCANSINFLIFPFNCLKSSDALLKEAQILSPPLELFHTPGLADLAQRVVCLYWKLAEEGIGVWLIC